MALEKALATYLKGSTDAPFNIKSVPLATAVSEERKPSSHVDGILKMKPPEPKKAAQPEFSIVEQLTKIPQLAKIPFGGLFKTCEKLPLTESETEYVVSCTKHVFSQHMVLQVNVKQAPY